MQLRFLLAFLAMCLVWGFHFVVLKLTVGEDAPPLFYAALRMSILALILSPLLRIHKGQMIRILLAGICLGGLNYAFMFSAITRVNASVVAIVLESYVPIAMVLSVIFLHEKIGWRRVGGLVAALAGVVLIGSAKGVASLGVAPLLGIAFTFATAISEAFGAILVKSTRDVKPLALLAWFALVGSVVLWTATLLFEENRMLALQGENRWPFMAALAYSVLLASLFGHSTYYWLLSKFPVSRVSPSTIVATLIGVMASVAILNEPLTWQLIVGGVMVISGVWVIIRRSAHDDKTPADSIAPAEN